VRDSSLSACTQAVLCAEVGHLDLAHDYAWEAALVDLRDLHANTRHGLHLASLAGAWSAMVEGFGGLRERDGTVSLAPRLPTGVTGLRFRLRHSGLRLLVEVEREQTRVSVRDGSDGRLSILLYDEKVDVAVDSPVTRSVVVLRPLLPRPEQPPGYAPDRAVPAVREAS
jgi:alpha,alpha-trehalose phosphorylase